ncbi:HNH endonuclease (plasmid) [Streptomyces platensis]|uniref:HNH endonuclease n=1 Tax=Streptomyces platensis TaxID=58346 RepID=UPI002ED16D3C|nr:HNH endonuclease [Streptomyces platensis]
MTTIAATTGRVMRHAALSGKSRGGHPFAVREIRTAMNYTLRAKGVPVKICSRCLIAKALTAYNRYRSASDGLNSYCRSCHAAGHAAKVATDPEFQAKMRANGIAYYHANSEARRRYAATYRASLRKANLLKNANRVQDPSVMRQCVGRCGLVRPETDFRLDRGEPDGLRVRCRDCAGRAARIVCAETYGAPAGKLCYLCDSVIAAASDAHVDHLLPTSRGGPDAASNLWWAHSTCNIRRGARPLTPQEWDSAHSLQRQATASHASTATTKEMSS